MKSARLKNSLFALAILGIFLLSADFCGCDVRFFWSRKAHLTDIINAMFPPAWGFWRKALTPLAATIQMSVTGTALGSLLALVIAPLCAANLNPNPVLRGFFRVLIQVLRSFPALILALIATFIFGLGTFSGTVAITLFTFAIMTRLTYEDIETSSLQAYNALCAMGAAPSKSFFRAVFPQVLSSYLTNALYLLETNVRHSAILGYVGAGGIGLLLNEKTSWREYDKVGMILFMLFIVVCFTEYSSEFLASVVRGERKLKLKTMRAIKLLAAVLFVICTLTVSPPDFSHTNPRIIAAMLSGLIHPDWAFFFDASSSGLMYLLLETVAISVTGTVIGAVFALPLAFLSTSRFMPKWTAFIFRAIIAAIRSIPFLIYGLIFIRVCGPGAFTGVMTLAVCSIGLLCKRFTEAIDALDFRAYHALSAMGIPLILRIRYAILPQFIPSLYSAVLYRFDVNIREASILGLVGAGGIGAPLIFSMNHFDWHTSGAIVIGLIILVWIVDVVSVKIRKSI